MLDRIKAKKKGGEKTENSSMEGQDVTQKSGTPDTPVWKPTTHERLAFLTLAIVTMMIAFDGTLIVTSLNAISIGIKATTVQAFWIGTSFLLACAVVMPFVASLSDIFGRPGCLLSSLLLFTVGTIVCCVAKDFAAICAGRVIQGIGAGGIQVLTLIVITDIVPLRIRPKIVALVIQVPWAFGSCMGPFFGGLFAQYTTWRWVFYMMFPFAGIGLLSIPLTVRLQLKRESTLAEKLARVDWIGGGLFIASMTSFLIAISWGGTQEPWGSFRTIVPLILGLLGLALAIVYESRFAKEPFFRGSLLSEPTSIIAYLGALVQGLVLYASLYYLPFYFESVRRASPTRAGVLFFATTFATIPVSVVAGGLITKTGKYRIQIWVGFFLAALGQGLYVLLDRHTSLAALVIFLIISGFGHGLLLPALNVATQAMTSAKNSGAAGAMYIFARTLGMALGIAIGGTVFQNVMKIKLRHYGLDTDIARQAEAYVATAWSLPDPQHSQVLAAYSYGFHGVFGVLCAISSVLTISTFLLKHHSLDRENETEHVMRGRGAGVQEGEAEAATTTELEAQKEGT